VTWAPVDELRLVLDGDGSFRDALASLRAVAPRGGPHFTFSLLPATASGRVDRRCGKKLERGGRISPVEIQRIVRANFGQFRRCYEDGLQRNAHLQGRVATRFVIADGGRVASAQLDESTDLNDPIVNECVRAGFEGLVFPEPENGIVTVVYPLIFNPGE
jgi:hypothetical protein